MMDRKSAILLILKQLNPHFIISFTCSEMMHYFQLEMTMCKESQIKFAVRINISSADEDEDDICDNITLASLHNKAIKRSDWFSCQRPLIAPSTLTLFNTKQKKICINAISLETGHKKYFREGLHHISRHNEWSDSIKLLNFGKLNYN